MERGERAGDRAGAVPSRRFDPNLQAGSLFSHFRILGVLGRGGMGMVYRAADLHRGGQRSDQEVALKLLSTRKIRDPRNEARFWREAQTAASLTHPNIGSVYEVGEHEGQLFLAMPLYDGQTLAQRLDRAAELDPMPIPEVVSIADQLASALGAAHGAGIVHRDVKPANLILLRGEQLKLLDFGLARWEGAVPLTDFGAAVGTVVYMAPEQLRGEAGGPRADLWSFGAVVYEMLAGRPPFGRSGPQPVQWLIQAILEQDPPPLHELRPDVPPALAHIVERCLAKDPADRYGSAEEILAELRESGLVRDPQPPTPRPRWRRVAVAAALLLAVAAGVFLVRRPAPRPLEVSVLRPEIEGSVSEADRARLAESLQQATRHALEMLPRIRTVTSGAADEVVAVRAYCGEQICQVLLHRLSGADGSDLWSGSLEIPVAKLGSLPEEVAPRIRAAYAGRR